MSKYLDSAKNLTEVIYRIEECFDIDSTNIKLGTDGSCGLTFTVDVSYETLHKKHWTDEDFQNFCKVNELNGIIFFQKDYAAFVMSPKVTEQS